MDDNDGVDNAGNIEREANKAAKTKRENKDNNRKDNKQKIKNRLKNFAAHQEGYGWKKKC
jgi:hypothetical protein